jgi:hypothetical protein
MVLSKIQENIATYLNWLHSIRHHPFLYEWETVQQFQVHWNPGASGPVEMFDRCLQNSATRRLWQEGNWQPKRMMLEFWRFDPMTVRAMFDDLFNESREIESRCSRFIFGCDLLLADYKKVHFSSVDNNHYHDDYRMIALYLACRYPEQYAPYDFQVFRQTLVRLGAHVIPEQNDIGRYFKVMRTLMNFLDKDPRVAVAMEKHLVAQRHYRERALLVASDFCRFIVRDSV